MPKTVLSKTKSSSGSAAAKKKKTSAARARESKKLTTIAIPKNVLALDEADSFTLEQAAKRLGPADKQLEAALRELHTDHELQRKGSRVASERILADGQRFCSKALVHLQSKDPEVKHAAQAAGLTAPMVALTVDALLRLKGVATQVGGTAGTHAAGKQLASHSLEGATAAGRALKRNVLDRLELIGKTDERLTLIRAKAAASAGTPERLADQLEALAALVTELSTHESPAVRLVAISKGLGAEEAASLTAAAETILATTQTLARGNTRQEERQALLDVLDGLCLLLLEDLVRALRAMARTTHKVRRPTIVTLTNYFKPRTSSAASSTDADADAPQLALVDALSR